MKNFWENKNSSFVACALIFLISIFLRSRIDIGGDSAFQINLAAKISKEGRYYYDFFESNFPLSFWIYVIPYRISQFLNISPIVSSDIFINLLGILSLFFSARILKESTLRIDHQNLIISSFALGFFLRVHALPVNEFATKTSFCLLLAFPYISFSFARKNPLTTAELIWRGIFAGLIPCLKPHYIFLPLLIEIDRFRQKKSLRFFVELDKLLIVVIGLGYLLLMLKFTPEFFEFMVPMWSSIYGPYVKISDFWGRVIYHLSSKIIFFSGFFLVFLRKKFAHEDRIL